MWPFRRDASSGAAEKLVARGKIEAAIKMYRRVLKANPGDSSTLNRVGDLLARVDKYTEAIQLYRETAELFVEQGFYVKAIAVYKKIHRLDPGQLDVYRKLAELYTLQGLHNDARTHYEVLVDYHDRQGDLPAAIGVCRKLAELQPQDPAHRTRLAELYERKGDTASVAREYLEIARMLLVRGAFEKATQVLERALAVNCGDANLLIDSVRLLRSEGHHDFAESFLKDAEEMNVKAGRLRLVADVRERLRPDEPPAVAVAPVAVDAGDGKPAALSLDPEEDVYLLQVDDEAPADEPAAAAAEPQLAEDALAEIDVFVKYGFREKALDRLGDLLRAEPRNLLAYQRLVELLLRDRSHRAAVEAANQMSQVAVASGQLELWREIRERLREEGFLISGDTVKAAPAELRDDSEEFELLETGPETPAVADLDSIVAQARADSAASSDLFEILPPQADQAAESEAPPPRAAAPASPSSSPGQEGVEFVVVDDGEFADLAEEVEREIETAGAAEPVEVEAPSVEEIVASFKQGVAENLSPEDYDTHYNLGIAYREMGLIDEAIGEFEIAIKSRDYMIGCCSLLGLCFRDKGEADTAMDWYRRGLAEPDLLDQERHALLYDLAETYETAGDLESARKACGEISNVDGGYRDVGERLAAVG
ncbi:MAG TPA: tetratricopeptide repeat protein [Thermoanaerobaculia bacterium]|nr:tetratricopeptide repeat protein [Thermoanaerobaculia bacterium]